MVVARRVTFGLGTAVLLVALGLLLGTIVARINQSSADTLTLRSSVLQASGDQLGLWHDEAKTDPVTSLQFRKLQIQPPLRPIGPDMSLATVFVENMTTGDLYLVGPCGDVESPPGTTIGTIDTVVHNLGDSLLGNTCDVPATVVIVSGDLVKAEVRIELAPGLASGDYSFQTMFDAVSHVAVEPPAGMVSWWPGDDNANDIVDSNDGMLSGDATFGPGMVGQAFSLDGTGDVVIVSDSPNLNIIGDVTVDLWAKRTLFGGGSPLMIAKGAGTVGVVDAPNLYFLSFDSTDHLNGGFERADGSNVILIGPIVTDTNFHHYAYVRSGDTHKLFIDGVMVTGDTFTGSPGDTSGIELAIGGLRHDAFPSGFCCHFGGVLDEVELFNRALSADEIRAIYEAGSAGKIKPEPPEPIPPPAGMVSWWPGDGNAIDIVDGNPGTLQGGASFAPGKVGQAFSLNGVDDFVEIAHNPNLDPGTGSFTVDAWVKSTATADLQMVISKYECGGQTCARLIPLPDPAEGATSTYFLSVTTGGKLDVFLRDTDGGGACGGGQCLVGAAPIADGKFHHIAMVRDIQANNLLLYVDGNLDIGVPLNAGAQGEIRDDEGEPDPFLIGASALARFPPVTTKANFFSGTIDEVEIFNRALSAGEIRAIYDAGSAGKIKP